MESLGIFLSIVIACFLFSGTPDLFDKYHTKLMADSECADLTQQPMKASE